MSALCIAFIQHEFYGKGKPGQKVHVALLDISGVIMNSQSFTKNLKEILERPNAKALVVRINSPGGVVGPSQEMYEALKKADAKIPVVISMGPLAASGGYYAALGGRKIFASPGTLTASIGVIMEFVNTEKLYEWAKIAPQTLKAGKFKDVGSPNRPMKPEERALLQAMLDNIHTQFKATVKERRNLPDEEVEKYCDGRVMTGEQAFKAHLVDALGGFEDAVKEAKLLAKLPDDTEVNYPVQHKGLLKELLVGDDEAESSIERLATGLLNANPLTKFTPPGFQVLLLAPVRGL